MGHGLHAGCIQFVQLIPQTTDRTNLQFVQSAGAFLAIATDERDGGTFVNELDSLFNLPFRDAGSVSSFRGAFPV